MNGRQVNHYWTVKNGKRKTRNSFMSWASYGSYTVWPKFVDHWKTDYHGNYHDDLSINWWHDESRSRNDLAKKYRRIDRRKLNKQVMTDYDDILDDEFEEMHEILHFLDAYSDELNDWI